MTLVCLTGPEQLMTKEVAKALHKTMGGRPLTRLEFDAIIGVSISMVKYEQQVRG